MLTNLQSIFANPRSFEEETFTNATLLQFIIHHFIFRFYEEEYLVKSNIDGSCIMRCRYIILISLRGESDEIYTVEAVALPGLLSSQMAIHGSHGSSGS